MKNRDSTQRRVGQTVYETFWPRGKKSVTIDSLASRLDNLEGKTICELWDGIYRGDEIFVTLEERLSERYPGLNLVSWTEFPRDGDHGFPDWKAYPHLLRDKGCDGVIFGCGA